MLDVCVCVCGYVNMYDILVLFGCGLSLVRFFPTAAVSCASLKSYYTSSWLDLLVNVLVFVVVVVFVVAHIVNASAYYFYCSFFPNVLSACCYCFCSRCVVLQSGVRVNVGRAMQS